MANQLFVVACAALLVAAAFTISSTGAHSLIIGRRQPRDYLAQTHRVYAAPQRNAIVTRQWYHSGLGNITLIQAIDQFTNGTGGYAWLASGGINQSHVTIGCRSSAVNRGFAYDISIYALPRR